MNLDTVRPATQRGNSRKGGRLKKEPIVEPVCEAKHTRPRLDEILGDLENKLVHTRGRQTEISSERKAISLAAHMGSATDRARLDQLNQEGAVLSGEVESIEAAIVAVKAQIADAEAEVAREAERERKQEIVQLADEARLHAEVIDNLWQQSIAEFIVLQDKLHEIAQAGNGRPGRHQVQAVCRRALIAAFIGSPLQLQLLAPGQRYTMAGLVDRWVGNIEKRNGH
jgi:hypothetical protein